MSWIQNIFGGRQVREAGQGAPGIPASTTDDKDYGKQENVSGGSYAENIIYARSPQVALTVSAVHRAVELRAKTLAMMLLQYQTKNRLGGNFQQDTSDYGSSLNWLLQVEPNPIMSAGKLIVIKTIDMQEPSP